MVLCVHDQCALPGAMIHIVIPIVTELWWKTVEIRLGYIKAWCQVLLLVSWKMIKKKKTLHEAKIISMICPNILLFLLPRLVSVIIFKFNLISEILCLYKLI